MHIATGHHRVYCVNRSPVRKKKILLTQLCPKKIIAGS